MQSLSRAAFKEDEKSVPAASGGKRNPDAIREYLALQGASKIMGQQHLWRLKAE
jgi:hypothetical protein